MLKIFDTFGLDKLFILVSTLFYLSLSQHVVAKEHLLDPSSLGLNDIAYLWPAPQNRADVEALIDAKFQISSGEIWSKDTFDKVIYFAEHKVNGVDESGNEIKISFVSGSGEFANQLRDRANWKVVGFRVDPSAPSTSPQVITQMGSIPQIRLILQPVTVNEAGVVTVHDYAAHLPFNFILNLQPPFSPDKDAFSEILKDLVALKNSLSNIPNSEPMDGPLKANNNLSHPVFAEKVSAFLHDHLAERRLTLIAFMGIANSDQWVFFDFDLTGNSHSPNSQLLHVKPSVNNGFVGNRIANQINENYEDCKGVSTAVLFEADVNSKLDTMIECLDITKKIVSAPLLKDIPNIIANPLLSNVINTDCVSCHTESTRRSILGVEGVKTNRFTIPSLEPFVMKDFLPTDKWNVRNFGWFTKDVLSDPKPIISTRVSNEVASSLEFIENNYSN